jgi:hypothetical protein
LHYDNLNLLPFNRKNIAVILRLVGFTIERRPAAKDARRDFLSERAGIP